ncbi:isoprenylcysteine carboxylmethyltransferase family protein [uncultured Spongiibacter sp.]|uniref:methyltransferase family protein n=1 Tax=uncultured Spongiibacter sp. TaxID=870896 RepID=UPI002584098E|nr:isoprenylcysteine carboxylmethyltransferase family protein [uncultured Spongiibacter sp.]
MKGLENKIPPPAVALLVATAMWGLAEATPNMPVDNTTRLALVALCYLLGAGFSLGGVMSFRRAKTTVNPLKPESASALVDTGIYRYTRNPMYVGFALFLLAWAVFLSSLWALLGLPLFIAYIQRFQIRPEERALEQIFGSEFLDYKRRVRRWL